MPPIRALIVDDSVVVRKLLSEALASTPGIQLAGTASSGALALAKIPQLNPDLITLDVEMPGLNGIETLREIRKLYPKLPVIMFSTLTEHGAAITLEALTMGASDYLAKPTNSQSLACAMEQVRSELSAKIFALCGRKRQVLTGSRKIATSSRPSGENRIEILAVGTSTGGPNALADVIPQLPERFPVPVVVVQHMPPLFTRLLAERLNARSHIPVHEAEPGHALEAGNVWIAPGDHHMTVSRKGTATILELNQDPPENSCRPAVDVLFRSVARVYGPNVLAVVMTGMGADGARGAGLIREAGGEVFVQDEASSVVWGMPGAVVQSGYANKICPLPEISADIIRRVQAGRERGAIGVAASPA